MGFNKELFQNRIAASGIEEVKREFDLVEQGLDLYQGKDREALEKALQEQGGVVVKNLDLSLLKENPDNHFHKIEGDAWEEFTGSIREKGIVTPLIVRPFEDGYQIVAGHNRYRAAQEIGLRKAPCIVKELDDVEASVLIGITNNQREDTTDLEWGWAYRNTYETLKKAVGRPKNEATEDEKENTENNCPTVGQLSQKKERTDEIVAQKYGVGRNTVQRKIRLTYLVPQLYDLGTKEKWSQKLLIDLSYLQDINQHNVVGAVENIGIKINEEVARVLREKEEAGELDVNGVLDICENQGEVIKKVSRPKKYQVSEDLFPEKLKKQERETYILRALEYIRDNGIDLMND